MSAVGDVMYSVSMILLVGWFFLLLPSTIYDWINGIPTKQGDHASMAIVIHLTGIAICIGLALSIKYASKYVAEHPKHAMAMLGVFLASASVLSRLI